MSQHRRNIPLRFTYPNGAGNIQFTNQISFSQIDMDVVMDVGVVDPRQLMQLGPGPAPGQPDVLEAIVLQRFGMSLSSFVKLKQQIDGIFDNLQRQGVLMKQPDPGAVQ